MRAEKPSERVRKRLSDLLADDRPDAERFLTQLRELRDLEEVQACSNVLHLLAHIRVPEPQAERLLRDLFRHRDAVTSALGRDPGLRVAAVDYLSNVKKLLINPTIVESSELEQTERSAITDSLTGLYNRRHFVERLKLEVQRCRRYRQRLSLLVLDIDGFKSLNDLHGHLFGDLVLQRVGRILRRAVREADVACRHGGEEFAVILPETDRLGAWAVAERIRLAVRDGFGERPIGGKLAPVTLSGGVSAYPEDGTDPKSLIACGDRAMYQSKRSGRNRISLFHSERREAVRYPARESVVVAVMLEDDPETIDAQLVDVSRLGAMIEMDRACPVSRAVRMTFSGLDPAGSVQHWIRVAQVVREIPGSTPGRFRAGVRFDRPLDARCLSNQVRPAMRMLSVLGGGA